jgi:cellulose biosynthesis protein BcsQ
MIIYVGSEKGGVGKTTTVFMLSLYVKHFYDVTLKLIDSDIKQQSLFKLMEQRKKNNLDYIDVVVGGDLKDIKKSDLVFIDGRANILEEDSIYMNECDLVLIPCGDSLLEVENTKSFINILEKNNIPYKVLFTRIQDKKNSNFMNEFDSKKVIKQVLGLSDRYSKISKNGQCDLDKSFLNVYKWQTKKEMENVILELLEK